MKCLDLPAVVDDFYLNVLDWSAKECIGRNGRGGVDVQHRDAAAHGSVQLEGR